MDRYDGFRGIVGERGVRIGELGRLWNVSIVGGIGVLDGRGPISMGKLGNGLGWNMGGTAFACDMDGFLLERDPELLVPVGCEGIFNPSISSSSSIEGNVVAKLSRLRADIRGEEEVEEDGEGGPRLEVGTRACGDGADAVGDPSD